LPQHLGESGALSEGISLRRTQLGSDRDVGSSCGVALQPRRKPGEAGGVGRRFGRNPRPFEQLGSRDEGVADGSATSQAVAAKLGAVQELRRRQSPQRRQVRRRQIQDVNLFPFEKGAGGAAGVVV